MSDAQQSVWALENGSGLRTWVEETVSEIRVHRIRCATFAVGVPGLLWLVNFARQRQAKVQIISDDGQTDPNCVPPEVFELIRTSQVEWRTLPVRPGSSLDEQGFFHPKILLFDDCVAVVGSANLTGRGLALSIPPHHVEMSVGLCGSAAQPAIDDLRRTFEVWWRNARPLDLSARINAPKVVGDTMPEYVVFGNRPAWGIAQVQTGGGGMFGQAHWLALSDISPSDPEHISGRIQVPHLLIDSAEPIPWQTPAVQLAARSLPSAGGAKNHFRRLCAYWLQAENRQGQLDNIPVLPLRHQASLVEYLMRRDTPTRMLIGDEVGLGKTVEVGLLIERLQSANPDLRILYITLGSLVTNVADEFSDMGLENFYVYANTQLDERQYQHAHLGTADHNHKVIASLHRLGRGSNWEQQLQNTKWDVVIVDECHRLRMYGEGDDVKAQQWFRVVEGVLKSHLAEDGRVYFLSGTPHQGNPEVFLNLAGLLCGLPRNASQREKQQALSGRVIYRIKEEILDWDNQPLFPRRDIRKPTYAATPDEYNDLLTQIADYFDWLLSAGSHLPSNTRRAIGFVKSNALQYAASSPKAGFTYLFRRYLRNFSDEGNLATMQHWAGLLVPYRNRSANERPENLLDYLIERVTEEEEEPEDEETAVLPDSVGPGIAGEARQEEKKRLANLLNKYARLLETPQARSKFQELHRLLMEADEPFVVFAQSVDTVFEIKRFLEENHIACSVIVGGQDPAERKREIDKFRQPGHLGKRVLVSSSAGGEGINLQVARRLIHFDLPWNPMVLEQRIGRVHRIGTIDTVIVHTILLEGSREADIYHRLMEVLNRIVSALAQNPERRAELFRRILAGIPLETLRELFSGQRDDDDAIAAAVEAGQQSFQLVDAELRTRRVQISAEDKGRATMEKLVLLLESAEKIQPMPKQTVGYTQIRYNTGTQTFTAEEKRVRCYRINDGTARPQNDGLIFNREAAAMSSEVSREQTGGINHPLIALALGTLRTPSKAEEMHRLAIGMGSYDKETLQCLTNGHVEPVVMLTYLMAYINGEHFFDHRLRVFTVSPSNLVPVDQSSDGSLLEDIFWSHLDKDVAAKSQLGLSDDFLAHIASQDVRLRKNLETEVKDDAGNWQGAVWPLALTILMPEDAG